VRNNINSVSDVRCPMSLSVCLGSSSWPYRHGAIRRSIVFAFVVLLFGPHPRPHPLFHPHPHPRSRPRPGPVTTKDSDQSEEPVICCASFTLLSIRFNCYCLSACYFSPPNWEITAFPLFTHLVGCPSAVHPGVPLLLLEIHLHLELVLLCHPLDSIRN